MDALSRAIDAPPAVAGVRSASAMAGLERRTVGFVDVLAQSIGAVAPTAAATTMPALVAAQAGNSVLLCLLLGGLLVAVVGYAVGQFTRRMAAPGSLYTFTTKGLGPGAGFAAAYALVVGYGFVAMFGLVGASLYSQNLLADLIGVGGGRWLTSLGVVVFGLVCFVVLRCGIRLSARVTLVVELVALTLLLTLLAVVLVQADPSTLLHPLTAGLPSPGHLVSGTTVAMTAFVGFESAASLGREARRPFLTIPRTMRWTLIGVGLVYLISTYTQQIGTEAFAIPLADNDLAMSRLASHSGVPWLGRVLEAGQAVSLAACAIASLTALSRIVFTLGREQVLPSMIGRADPLRRTPLAALAVAVPATVVLPLVLLLGGWSPWRTMSTLIVVSAVGYLGAYTLVCAAAPLFLRRIGELTPWTGFATGVAAAVLAVVWAVYVVVAAGDHPVALGMLVGLALLGLVGWAHVRLTRRRALDQMGLFDETTASDLLGGPLPAEPSSRP